MWFFGILLIVGLLIGFWYARKAFADWYGEDDTGPTAGFSMGDLREMRRNGKISEAEFERTKAMVIDSAKRAAAAPPAKKPLQGFHPKGMGFMGGFPVEPLDPNHDQKPR
jgi:hypothetical protein